LSGQFFSLEKYFVKQQNFYQPKKIKKMGEDINLEFLIQDLERIINEKNKIHDSLKYISTTKKNNFNILSNFKNLNISL
jgi:hypothetical protein